jgi:tripartite-type tricarboxylate transporter receptor subunit TctC
MPSPTTAARAALPCLLLAAALPAHAQTYPAKSIRVILPFAAGGITDLLGRTLARKLTTSLGQPVVIDNRIGAGGNIGTELAAKSAPDGYTVLIVPSSFSINPSLYTRVPYDPVKDFDPVSMLASYWLVLVAHPSFPVKNFKDVVALARAKPGYLNYASAGSGTTTHLAGELVKYLTDVRMTHIPFKGGGPAFAAVLGGQVELTFASIYVNVVTQIRNGRLRPLAVTGTRRSALLPDVPTVAESGLPGYEVMSWNAMFAPKGTPPAIVARLNAEVGKALAAPDLIEVLGAQGLEPTPGTPDDLARFAASELDRWAKVIKATGVRAD